MLKTDVKNENINGIVNKADYVIGYVGAIDILGFGNFSMYEGNYKIIRNTFNSIVSCKKNSENNLEVKYSLNSDTVVITIEVNNETKYDYVFFQTIVEQIARVRGIILKGMKLFSRGAITFGKYVCESQESNIIFGPAITRAVKLAEKADEFIITDPMFKNRPSSIIIDNYLTGKYPNDDINKRLIDSGIIEFVSERRDYKYVDNGYFVYNHFYQDYEQFKITSKAKEETCNQDFLKDFVNKFTDILNRQKAVKPEKYNVEEELLQDFLIDMINTK